MNELAEFESNNIINQLPLTLQDRLAELPESGQKEFLFEFSTKKKSLILAYIFHIMIGAAYGYRGKWFTQIIFWLTIGGLGLWTLIDFFRLPGLVRKQNYGIAKEQLGRLFVKYGLRTIKKGPQKPILANEPRKLNISYDPSNLKVNNLKTGFMLDFDLKTWKVITEKQYDWENGLTERSFVLSGQSHERAVIHLIKEEGSYLIITGKPINIYAINENLESDIFKYKRPSNALVFQGKRYYRETQKQGFEFNLSSKSIGKKIISWEYFDDSRRNYLRVEQIGVNEFKGFAGSLKSSTEFSDILPVH
ncbi:DUF4178 domain-containing protein [Flexithrix dorotheae]|uniref:DUF4178 domain-containing protein n=1 Tax=Flexithrix dorotheae TaxID=70993 RepID=UPI000361F216|nr:DUF4178 domain-containing protein [Flexithrix dorotheae]